MRGGRRPCASRDNRSASHQPGVKPLRLRSCRVVFSALWHWAGMCKTKRDESQQRVEIFVCEFWDGGDESCQYPQPEVLPFGCSECHAIVCGWIPQDFVALGGVRLGCGRTHVAVLQKRLAVSLDSSVMRVQEVFCRLETFALAKPTRASVGVGSFHGFLIVFV